jgi:hypothetical protein
MIAPVVVDPPADFAFAGCVRRDHVKGVWTWMRRDLGVLDNSQTAGDWHRDELEPMMPDLLAAARDALQQAEGDATMLRRLATQLGDDDIPARLPGILFALRNRALLPKAQAFGRATASIADEAGIVTALQSMPLKDAGTAAMLLFAAMGQVPNPSRMVNAAIRIAGGSNERALLRARMGPLVDAILAQAQNQQHLVQASGPFADIDLACRAIERFHRLVRSISGYVELERGSPWSQCLGSLTRSISDRVEPRLREIVPHINGALRRGRDGFDRIDNDQVLAAMGGVYLLATLRDCRDSLALNALFEQVWSQAGQALETHIERALDLVRQDPANAVAAERLDIAIKLAEIRFNQEYAETLRRAAAAAVRR